LQDVFAASLLTGLRPFPYNARIATVGWVGAHLIGPLAGLRRRVHTNLDMVAPDLAQRDRDRIARRVPGNMARTIAEIFYGPEFASRAVRSQVEGTGLSALHEAHAKGQPVILVTGHFGNYDAARALLLAQGFNVAGFYMPMRNPAFNKRYVAAISRIGTPVFARGREGMAAMLRFLRKGGMVGLVADHYMPHGELLDFMGKPARTALSGAELALKYNALLVPVYGIRNTDGISFRVRIEAPIPHSDALSMTRALNASLEALVRQHMDQWMWTHRRWKRNQPDAQG
jgi:KDO2-lipid IV(A) lauroyltransferase